MGFPAFLSQVNDTPFVVDPWAVTCINSVVLVYELLSWAFQSYTVELNDFKEGLRRNLTCLFMVNIFKQHL